MPYVKVKNDPAATPYPGKLPVRTRSPPPAPRRGLLSKAEREPTMAERYPGPKPPERTRPPVPPAVQLRESERPANRKERHPGPMLPERTRPPEPPVKPRRGSTKSEPGTSLKERYPGPKLPERTRPPVPQRASTVDKFMSFLSIDPSRNNSASTVSTKHSARARERNDVRDDKGSGHHRLSRHRPHQHVSRSSSQAPSSANGLCDLSVCDMACGVQHEDAPSFVSARSSRAASLSAKSGRSGASDSGHSKSVESSRRHAADQYVHDQARERELQRLSLGLSSLRGLGVRMGNASAPSLPPVMESKGHDDRPARKSKPRQQRKQREPVSLAPVAQEDITVTLWARDGDKHDSGLDSIPYETDSESEPEECSVTLFPRRNSRIPRTPSVIVSEHNENQVYSQNLPTRSHLSVASSAMTGYYTAYSDVPSTPASPSPLTPPLSAEMTESYVSYNQFAHAPLALSYNQYRKKDSQPPSGRNPQNGGSADGHLSQHSSVGRQRPTSWHVNTPDRDTFGNAARSPKHMSPPDMDAYADVWGMAAKQVPRVDEFGTKEKVSWGAQGQAKRGKHF